MPREMIENERSSAIHTAETVEEKVSLSDRFGLWLGFHPLNQETFLLPNSQVKRLQEGLFQAKKIHSPF